jgi:hypothetical protein
MALLRVVSSSPVAAEQLLLARIGSGPQQPPLTRTAVTARAHIPQLDSPTTPRVCPPSHGRAPALQRRSHKGSNLALMVELLAGPLVGAAVADKLEERNWGNLVLVIDPSLLGEPDVIKARTQVRVHGCGPCWGCEGVCWCWSRGSVWVTDCVGVHHGPVIHFRAPGHWSYAVCAVCASCILWCVCVVAQPCACLAGVRPVLVCVLCTDACMCCRWCWTA